MEPGSGIPTEGNGFYASPTLTQMLHQFQPSENTNFAQTDWSLFNIPTSLMASESSSDDFLDELLAWDPKPVPTTSVQAESHKAPMGQSFQAFTSSFSLALSELGGPDLSGASISQGMFQSQQVHDVTKRTCWRST
jgi:hypothetical protein